VDRPATNQRRVKRCLKCGAPDDVLADGQDSHEGHQIVRLIHKGGARGAARVAA